MEDHLHTDYSISCLKTRTSQTTWTHNLNLKHPKPDCGFGPQPQGCSIPQLGPFALFPSTPRPRLWKTQARKFLGGQIPGAAPRPRLHIPHRCTSNLGSVHTTMHGHGHPQSSSSWPAGNLALTSLFNSLWSPHSTLKLVSVLWKLQNQIWEEEGNKGQPERGLAEGQSLPVHPLKGLYHWDCLISKTELISFPFI